MAPDDDDDHNTLNKVFPNLLMSLCQNTNSKTNTTGMNPHQSEHAQFFYTVAP